MGHRYQKFLLVTVTPLLENLIGLLPGLRNGDDVISKISDKFSSGNVVTGNTCFESVLKNSDMFSHDIYRFSCGY